MASPPMWVFTRRGIPLRVLSKDENWIYVEEPQSARCWVNETVVAHAPYVIVRAGAAVAGRSEPKPEAALRARLEAGVIGRIAGCANDWRKLEIANGLAVWVLRSDIWGDIDGCSTR